MPNVSNLVKTIQDIMRKDAGTYGDAQRLEQLGWMFFLKIFDDREKEMAVLRDTYKSPLPQHLRWSAWAADAEGITGDALLDFVNNTLLPKLKALTGGADKIAGLIRMVFEDANNYMKNGTLMRQVINKINGIDFNASDDRHMFGDIYEKLLKDLQSAGNSGEFYTPRAVTQFIVDQVNPRLGETILDPACGTGGFLVCAIEYLRKQAKTEADERTIQDCFEGIEKKHLPHVLCMTNLLLHGIDVPSNVRHDNTLARPLRDWSPKERVDVIVTNPPFGGMEEDGIEANFPTEFRTRETADLFLVLLMKVLKPGGRAGLVLPDGTLFGEGVKTRIKEALLTDCNLHTIVRLPNGVFNPYTGIRTNLLFFTKGAPTTAVWYYEHPYPAGAKSYNKGKPIRIEEFDAAVPPRAQRTGPTRFHRPQAPCRGRNPTEPVYVYVRVTNKSCETASGDDQLELYWAKASTALNWPDYWDGTITNSQNHPLGGQVPVTLNIPRLKPGQEAILEFPWMVPNPAHYSNDPDPWHFCLLARIVSDDDPMTTPEVTYIVDNVKNNNNIGWKNTTIVDLVPDLAAVATGGKVGVVNTFNETKTFKLEFFAEPNEKGKPIYEEAEVGVVMDSLLRAAWIAGGSQGSNYASPSASNPRIIATGDNMVLDNITLPAGAYTTMDVNFNFLINELTSKRKFTYHVLLREVASGKVIGGETYIINKLPRPTFTAFAGGDETIEKNDSITLQAADIGEDAVYNWYDPEGNLIHTGTDLTVSPLITQTYKLEVITDIDGHKDYDNITISVNPYKIQSIIPNPASSNVIINYDVEGAVSAYIMLVNQTTSNSDNYILDIEETSVSIDVSSYPSGLYSVVLVVNGEIQSSKNLSINH